MKKMYTKKQITEAESSSERIDIGSYTCSSSLVQSAYSRQIGGGYMSKPYYATIRAKDSGKSIIDFTWRKKMKYLFDGKYKKHTVFYCELDPWFDKGSSASRHLRDIAMDIDIDEAQKLYEKICRSLAANAPVDNQTKLETLVKKAVDSLGLRTKQREWYELAGSDHALDESAKMKKRYTKKQIQEAISYWERQLGAMNESSGSQSAVKGVSLVAVLDSFEVFDECANWSEVSGVDSYLAKFTGEAARKVASAFSGEDKSSIKLLGIAKVMSAEEYAEYAERNESDAGYDDYVSNESYRLQETLSNRDRVCAEFKAAGVLVVDGVVWEGSPGKTVLVVPYAVR